MSERCDICGIPALESEQFAEERLPFRKPKRYCPACRKKFYQRVYAILAVIPLLFACIGIVQVYQRHMRLLDSPLLWLPLLCIFQWLTILPHELGHATAARCAGFTQLRILVGMGRPIFSFNLLGVPVLVNLIPFGGVTLFKDAGKPNRWKHLAVVAAGPLVNLAAAAVAVHFIAPGTLFDHVGTVPTLLFLANLIVLAENLFPYLIQTPLGNLATDGLQLWNILFRWNKPLSLEPSPVPLWEVMLCQFLKWTVFLITLAGTLFFVLLAALPFLPKFGDAGWGVKIVLPAIMVPVALLAGWITVRIAKEPVARVRKPVLVGGFAPQTFSWSPEQQQLVRKAIDCAAHQDFAQAEAALDEVIGSIPDPNSASYVPPLLMKLQCIISQNAIERAEKVCLDFVNLAASTENKIKILDGFVCQIIYQPTSPFLKTAERLARLALQIAPGTLTLKGSLGGILAEQGNFTEAEPLLQECLDRSPALHDQGISCFYLGVVKLGTGKVEEAKRLINRSMILYPEPWLLAKAKAKLKDLEANSGRP